MKKLLIVVLSLVMVLNLIACGDFSLDKNASGLSEGVFAEYQQSFNENNSGSVSAKSKSEEPKKVDLKQKNSKSSKELASRIKKIFEKEKVKELMRNGGSSNVREFIINSFEKVGDDKVNSLKNQYPDLSFDNLKFKNDDDAYNYLANNMKYIVKAGVQSGSLDQETIDGVTSSVKESGKSIADIKVSKNMSDADIEKLCIWWLDYFDRVFDNAATKENGDFAYAMGLMMFLGFLGIPS